MTKEERRGRINELLRTIFNDCTVPKEYEELIELLNEEERDDDNERTC